MLENTFRRLFPRRWMRSDWDRRARENAQHFIACGHAGSDEAFWSSGAADLEELILHGIALQPDARALEIGCGMGRLVRPLSERIEHVYGVDISGEMVARALAVLADRPNVTLFTTAGNLRPVPTGSLDLVFSFIVFQHIPSRRAVTRYIREASRVLKAGGVFRFQVDGRAVEEHYRTDTWRGVRYEPEGLRSELEENGLAVADLWGEGTHYLWVTAVRRRGRGLAETRAVRVRGRTWSRDELESLLDRMGGARSDAEAVIRGERSIRQLAHGFLSDHAADSPEEFVRSAYRVFLGREADAGGLAFYTREIAGGIARSNTLDCLISSSEFERRLRADPPPGARPPAE
jgi:SAM-dependent methyltransferase